MMTRYRAALDGHELDAIDPDIYIIDIAYHAPDMETVTAELGAGDGIAVLSRRTQSSRVTVSFAVREQDTMRRQDVVRRVQTWAMRGGMLTTSDRPGTRLNVICERPPSVSSALKWTETMQAAFAAYEKPFWEDAYPRTVTISGANGGARLYMPGVGAMTHAEAEVRNTSDRRVDAVTVQAGASRIELRGLELESGQTLTIDHDEKGRIRIRAGEKSKMACRTAESDDELLMETGASSDVRVTADADVQAIIRARGLYL